MALFARPRLAVRKRRVFARAMSYEMPPPEPGRRPAHSGNAARGPCREPSVRPALVPMGRLVPLHAGVVEGLTGAEWLFAEPTRKKEGLHRATRRLPHPAHTGRWQSAVSP